MSKPMGMFSNARDLLVLVLFFFVSLLFGGIIYGPIMTVLFYLFQRYYKRSKKLEKQVADLTSDKSTVQPPSSIPPPPSTDA